MRKAIIALAGTLVLAGAGSATADHTKRLERIGDLLHGKVQKKVSVRAPGRNIVAWGIVTRRGTRPARERELRRFVGTLRRMLDPPRQLRPVADLPTNTPTNTPTTSPTRTRPSAATRAVGGTPPEYVAQCESGGNPRAISPGGTYRGKWQFDRGTWGSVGGVGDPAAATEAEQDRRAAILYAREGLKPWGCG